MTKPIADLDRLIFMFFIYIADVEQDITPQEVQNFNGLLGSEVWSGNPIMKAALDSLRAKYNVLWAAYDADELHITHETITQYLETITDSLGAEEAVALRQALADFARRIHQPVSPVLGRMGLSAGLGTGLGARQKALAEVEKLLLPTNGDHAAPPVPPSAIDLAAAPRAMARVSPLAAFTAPPPAAGPPAARPAFQPALPSRAAGPSDVAPIEAWTGGRTRVRCVNVTAETADVKTYSFVATQPCHFFYKPGQFVTLELPIEGRVLRRSYTISSSPSRPHILSITVKRVPKGWISNWLYETMAEGTEFELTGPHGDFSCLNHPSEKMLLLSGGSGVTPMMSTLRFMADTCAPADIVFLNNVRTPQDIIFEKELAYLATRLGPALRLAVVPAAVPPGQAWNGPVGHLDERLLQFMAPDFREREIFVCGPPGYMQMIRALLEQLGHPMAHYHEESFGSAPIIPSPAAPPEAAVTSKRRSPQREIERPAPVPQPTIEVVFARSGKSALCNRGDTILDAAERHGIALTSSCRMGVCGTCRLRKTEGEVLMEDQKFLVQHEIEEGYLLACVSHPQGRVTIDA